MRSRLIIVALIALGSFYACKSSADNARDFSAAKKVASEIDRLVKDGPTDIDGEQIDCLFSALPSLRRVLTDAQQSVLWDRYPSFAGIACYQSSGIGHDWAGNDCAYQCGSFTECQNEVAR